LPTPNGTERKTFQRAGCNGAEQLQKPQSAENSPYDGWERCRQQPRKAADNPDVEEYLPMPRGSFALADFAAVDSQASQILSGLKMLWRTSLLDATFQIANQANSTSVTVLLLMIPCAMFPKPEQSIWCSPPEMKLLDRRCRFQKLLDRTGAHFGIEMQITQWQVYSHANCRAGIPELK